jgi:spore coat polysaccharide biosynthesis protein SpsF
MILGIIQARMNSTRLPGKVMLNLLGKPIIWRIYERLKFSKKIDKICICTSINSSDDVIANYAEKNNLLYHRGSEEDLISRHLGAAKKFNADILVRITSDDPLVDPEIIDELITILENNREIDFVSNTKVHTYPIGLDVEVFPTKTLEKFIEKSDNKIFHEYFISGYIFEHPNKFRSIGLELKKPNLLRWTLDYPEDYEFIKKIYFHLYEEKKIFLRNDIELLLKQKPELNTINEMHYDEFSHLKYKREFEK